MDNPLTPKKIQKLINLAEGRSYNIDRLLLTEEEVKLMVSNQANQTRSPAMYESSSGILDLEHVEGFGESGSIANMSLSKSTAFNPGEMTGRSTGADEVPTKSTLDVPANEHLGRHSLTLDSLTNRLNKQTDEIKNIMRHSIASNYSFHSKRDLTADEVSLIAREAPLPTLQATQTYFTDSVLTNNSNLSVGAYFKNRCVDFAKILAKTESPDKSNMNPSITEGFSEIPVSSSTHYDQGKDANLIQIDETLDSVPVRQPRNTDTNSKAGTGNSNSVEVEQQNHSVFKEPAKFKTIEKPESSSKVPEKHMHAKTPKSAVMAHKSFMTSSKPTDVLLKNLHSSFRLVTDDTEGSVENSLSISKIADFLGKQSNISVTDMMQLNKTRPALKKQPLTELHMNTHTKKDEQVQVTKLIDSKNTDTASTAGTLTTVISIDKLKIQDQNVPEVVITQVNESNVEEKQTKRSKSPSSKSPSTMSTVRDNNSHNQSSFKSGDSPNCSKGEANRSKVPSPNVVYKELDKSVDWQEILQQKRMRQRGVAKDHWVEIVTSAVDGYVGVSTPVTISVTTLSDSWLTAKFQFDDLPNQGRDLNVELPRLPLLLSPGKSEEFTFHLTSTVEMNAILPFSFYVKDASLDGDVEQKGQLQVNFKIPVLQAMSSDGMNKIAFPPIAEKSSMTKSFVLISDCPADLHLKLTITEGDSMFGIRNVQEIKKTDVNKVLLERQGSEETGKSKAKAMNKQLCRLVSGNAIRVSITFNAPKLSELNMQSQSATFNGALQVTLINGNTVLRRVDVIGVVGTARLVIQSLADKLHVMNEPTAFTVKNTGSVAGTWVVKYKPHNNIFPFKVSTQKFELGGGESKTLHATYAGPEDSVIKLPIRFEEVNTGDATEFLLVGGSDKPKIFPIKSNYASLSWVRAGRKEISLKNNIEKKVHVRCHIVGEGFTIDLPGGESRGVYVLSFNGCECRPLPIIFTPTSCMPHSATLHMAHDKNSEYSRKIKLFGCASGEPVRWTGLVTYSDTAALVRAAGRAPVDLKLHNKSTMPAFVAAKVHFNAVSQFLRGSSSVTLTDHALEVFVQYMQVEAYSRLQGANRVVAGRASHTISLRLDWPRVERRALEAGTTALATVTVLTGAETTRRRILKILKNESKGQLDVSLLPNHLKVLAMKFDGEDDTVDNFFTEFNEPKSSLNELIGGLQELTAHIDLPSDFAEEHTIIISDDTVADHHTLCD